MLPLALLLERTTSGMAGTPALSCCEALGLSRGFTVVTGVDWMPLWDEADAAVA